MQPSAQRVADRFVIRQAAARVASERSFRRRQAAVRDLDERVLVAFAEGFYLPLHEGKVAFGSLMGKLRELTRVFTKLPKLWQQFKDAIGVQSMSDLPGAIKRLASEGAKFLKKTLGKVFSTWPLMLYTLPEGKILSINTALEKIANQFPNAQAWMRKNVKPHVDDFDRAFRKALPYVGTALLVAAFIFIWWNVVEFEWDLEALGGILVGRITLFDLLISLPGSGLGFLMNGFGLGTFTLLPAALVARLLVAMAARYVIWTGRGFRIDWDKLQQDRLVSGEPPREVAALT